MIRFQADCGHIIEVEKKLAGQVVKCAYCGREVEAPRPEEPDLLFKEVDLSELARSESGGDATQSTTIHGEQLSGTSAVDDDGSGQKAVIKYSLIGGFATICLIVIIFITKSVMNATMQSTPIAQNEPSLADDNTSLAINNLPDATTEVSADQLFDPETMGNGRSDRSQGRVNHSFATGQGIFVEVFNREANVYVRAAEENNDATLGTDDTELVGRSAQKIELSPGHYRVAVAMELDARALNDLSGFDELREQLDFERDGRVAHEYFMPDTSVLTRFVDEMDVEQKLVRYYDVEVKPDAWVQATSMFYPRGSLSELLSALPKATLYNFSDRDARRTMSSLSLPPNEFSDIMNVLRRAGQFVYAAPDGAFYLLAVSVHDGTVSGQPYEVAEPAVEDELDAPSANATPDNTQPTQRAQPKKKKKNPWGRRGNRSKPKSEPSATETSLEDVVQSLGQRLQGQQSVPPEDWRQYLSGGDQFSLWSDATLRAKRAFLDLIDQGTAVQLIDAIGQTMTNDEPDLDSRLALLAVLERSADKQAIKHIDRRLQAIGDDPPDPDAAQQEEQALRNAKKKLGKGSGSKRKKNPWDR